MKKLLGILLIGLFATSVLAEEMYMQCVPTNSKYKDKTYYKYIAEHSGDKMFFRNKSTKNKYVEFCPNRKFPGEILVEGHNRIVENFKGICMVSKIVYDDGYEITSNTSVTDFVALTRTRAFFDNQNTGKIQETFKCKKRKKE